MIRQVVACTVIALTTRLLSAQGNIGDSSVGIEITAKLVLEDGSPLMSSPIVSLFIPGSEDRCTRQELFMDGTIRLVVPREIIHGARQTGCHISVMLTGYRKFTGFVQEGTLITLRRLGPNEGASVSASSLNAPANARKEYESGESAAARKKWRQAEEHFHAAASLYPPYALAWSELGQALQEQGRVDEATEAYKKARAADPLYIKPIVQLAGASGAQQRWDEEMRLSQEALEMHPVEYPAAYFYRAEAAYHLGKLEDAERFTREALELDPGGTFPQSLVLLGTIFENQGNPHDAIIEYRNYLDIAPDGSKAAEVKKALARLKHGN
jgi:tetratricopeptide (TPR) repeat protein